MVANFFSVDFGWLRGADDVSTQKTIWPGKQHNGYFEGDNVINQAQETAQIVQVTWPDFDHVFVYDNATTHKKWADDALSACKMPKFTSGTRGGNSAANFLVEQTQQDEKGQKSVQTRVLVVVSKCDAPRNRSLHIRENNIT
jgi:hypothetical protein